MRTKTIAFAMSVAGLVSAGIAGNGFEMTRSTIDGGGVMRSTGESPTQDTEFELSGTIGQPDAGVLSGGNFELTGGFWFQEPPGDCDQTGAADLSDMPAFVNCLNGPAGAQAEGPCRCFDLSRTGRIDLADFAELQTFFNGRP